MQKQQEVRREGQYVAPRAFVRDGFTWFAYIMLGYFTYLQATLGPLSAIFQTRFHLDYTSTGLPTGAFAGGVVLVGLCGEKALRPWLRHALACMWISVGGMALAAVALLLSLNMPMVVVSTFVMGVCGGVLQFVAQGTLAERHDAQRAVALTEANVVTSGAAVLAPLFVGGLQYSGLGGQTALVLALLLCLACAFLFRHLTIVPVEGHEHRSVERRVRFPLSFWCYWLALICGIAVEWSMIVWSAVFLKSAGMSNSLAATIVSLFFAAEVLGRLLGSRVIRSVNSVTLLLLSLVVAALGFLLFWGAPPVVLKAAGLFLSGLGIANLFPLTLAAAMGTVPHAVNAASARLSLGAGIAILSAPLLLGRVADAIGIRQAYLLVPCLIVIACIFIVGARWRERS